MPYAKVKDPTPAQIRRRAAQIQATWTAADEALRRGVHHLQIRDSRGHPRDLVLDQDGHLTLPVYVRGIEWVDDRA
jgi:hypothetical protein